MPERHDSDPRGTRDEAHEYWLAMQSAYEEYKRSSEALECVHQEADDASAGERVRLSVLEGQQRVAFERYVEARMAFLEFWFHESKGPGAAQAPVTAETEPSWIGSWLAFANQKPILQVLALLLLCTTAFTLVRDQKHVRDLEAAREELRTTRDQTRDGLELLTQKVNALGVPQRSPIQQVAQTPSVPRRDAPAAAKQLTAKRDSAPQTHVQFSLVPSTKFKRVGPIGVLVRSVDAQRKGVSLSIVSDRVKMDVQRLQPNQTVWIKVGDRQQVLGLVIDRIVRNRLDGHLVGPRAAKPELSSQLKSRFSATP